MDVQALASLTPDQLRALLPGFLAGFIVDEAAAASNRARVEAYVSDWDDATCAHVLEVLRTVGDEQRVYPADPSCRQLSRLWSDDVITGREVVGVEHLRRAMDAGPTVIVANHLSFFDSNAVDALLTWSGHTDLADRILSAAGPRVYEALFRRVAAACLNTLPVPQSTSFSHTAQLSPRELAKQALASLKAASDGAEAGLALLIYAEGSRTRTGRMGSFLKAVRRYLEIAEPLSVVPAAIVGTDHLMPVGIERLYPGPVALHFADALVVGPDLPAREALAAAHAAITRLLPVDHRPEPDTPQVV